MSKYYITWDLEATLPFPKIELDLSVFRRDLLKIIENSLVQKGVCEFIDYRRIVDFFNETGSDSEFLLSLENGLYIPKPDFNYSCTRTYGNIADIVDNPKSYQLLQRNWEPIWNQRTSLENSVLCSWNKNIVICDDGIFSWDTINWVIKTLNWLWKNVKEIRVVLNFSWKRDIWWIPIVSLYSPSNYIDRIDERDFFYWTEMWWASVKDKDWNIFWVPYCYSWEILAKKASLPGKTADTIRWLNAELYKVIWEMLWREIQLDDLERSKYLFPSKSRRLPIAQLLVQGSLNNEVAQWKKVKNPNLFDYNTIIRDQDGTLYQLDWDWSFWWSTLWKLVSQSIIDFICEKESCNKEEAQRMKSELSFLEKTQWKPLSQVLAEKYSMTRTEVFEATWWNIKPNSEMILNFEITKELLRVNKTKWIKNIVVTWAPKVRAEKVMKFMWTKDFIDEVYTAEDYEWDKWNVFSTIKQENPSDKILSIWDQEKSDILPALRSWIDGFVISWPSELSFVKD